MSYKEPKDICVHDRDRWNQGCEMCDALNSLADKNVTLQKYDKEDFQLTEEQMRVKYHIEKDQIDNPEEPERTVFPKYIPEESTD